MSETRNVGSPIMGESAQALSSIALLHSPVVFYVAELGESFPLVWISPNVKTITGHDAEEILNDSGWIRRFIHPDDRSEYDRRLKGLNTCESTTFEYRFQSIDGSYLWLREDMRIARDEGRDRDCLFGCISDVTSEKQAEQKLSQAEDERERLSRLLRDAVEASPHAFTVRDSEGKLVICNRAFAELYEEEPNALLGRSQEELATKFLRRVRQFDGIAVESVEKDFDRWLRRIKTIFEEPAELELKDGRWLLVTGHRMSSGGYALTRTDITKQKKTEQALRASEQRFRLLVESHPLPVWLIELESGKILHETPAVAKMFGREWPSKKVRYVTESYAFPEERKWIVERFCADGGVDYFELLFKRENGAWFWVAGSSKVLELDGKKCVISGMVDLTERKQREGELRDIRVTLEDAIESLCEGFALFDRDDRLVMCNTRYRELHPLSDDIIEPGMNWEDLIRSDLDKGWYVDAIGNEKQWLRARKKMRRDLQTNLEYEQSDGRWVSGSNRRTRAGGIVVTLNDITQKKLREKESIEAREMLEDAIESLGEGFVIWDDSDRLMMCNQRYRDINAVCSDILKPGVKFEEFMRTGAERGQYVDAIGRIDEWVEERARSRKEPDNSAEYQLSDGRWIFTRSAETRQGAHVAIRVDITERKKMEQALLESEGLVRRVLESCPVPLAMNRLENGEYIYISPSNAELLGIDPAEGPFFSPNSYADPKVREEYVRRLRKEKRIDNLEVQRLRGDGTPFWVSMSSRLIEYKGEEMIVSSIFDLTERHAVEEEMARQRRALYQSEKLSALGSLLASVAHELNNPLSIVVAQSMLLEELASEPKIAKRAEKISSAADRCARIVKTFLAMARNQPTEHRAVTVNDIVRSALDVTGYALRSADIKVTTRLKSELPLIWGDADQLIQVVTNLLLNAQQALEGVDADRSLKVTTSYRPTTGELVIKVKDNGPGIDPDIRSRIFEPYFTTKKLGSGTGIGLALCHRIIESHGGMLDLEETRGEGASFAIRFPESTQSDQEDPSTEKRQDAPLPVSVLVIDDEPDVLDVLADILRSDGHTVETAETGEAALKQLRGRSFDVVVSDLRMPDLDGPRLYDALKIEMPSVASRMVFLTGDTLSADIKEFLGDSGRPYLEKPINPRELRTLVREVVEAGAS